MRQIYAILELIQSAIQEGTALVVQPAFSTVTFPTLPGEEHGLFVTVQRLSSAANDRLIGYSNLRFRDENGAWWDGGQDAKLDFFFDSTYTTITADYAEKNLSRDFFRASRPGRIFESVLYKVGELDPTVTEATRRVYVIGDLQRTAGAVMNQTIEVIRYLNLIAMHSGGAGLSVRNGAVRETTAAFKGVQTHRRYSRPLRPAWRRTVQ